MPLLENLLDRPKDRYHEARRQSKAYKVLAILALIALILQTSMLFLSLFEKPLPYTILEPGAEPIDSPELLNILSAHTGGALSTHNRVEVLTNGEAFYAAEIAAIAAARYSVSVECYIFNHGRLTEQILHALEERARSGVQVRMVVDAVGSASFPDGRFQALRGAGGRVAWYHPLRWYSWPRVNNRTHRELLIVDGTVGFAGGAGFADQWLYGDDQQPRWRDTMVRVEGEAASGLAATFSENWLESSGEMIVDPRFFPFRPAVGETKAMVVTSSPTSGRSTEARMLFQPLLAKSTKSIHITTPYFLPDKAFRDQLAKARQRGVEVTVIVPGAANDHLLTRRSSRGLYGDMLQAGVRIFEYQPAMIHTKTMIVDGVWAVVGSTNLDARSFGLNDEVNVALPDPAIARRLEEDFENDVRQSRAVKYEEWKRRPVLEKIQEWFGWVLINQQ